MLVQFRFAFNDVTLDFSIEYVSDDFSFSQKLRHEAQNINQITRLWQSIDNIQQITLRTVHPLKIGYLQTDDGIIPVNTNAPPGFFATQEINFVEFDLTGIILFYKTGEFASWQTSNVPDWLADILKIHLAALESQIIGTARYLLPELKEAAKAEVTAQARRRANIMIGNAQSILQFLGEIV